MFSFSGTAEPSHMCDWNSGSRPLATRSCDTFEQRLHEAGQLVLGAVVGVQRDVDVVVRGDRVRELGERDGARHHALDGLAGRELRAAPRELHDAVALGLGEAADGRDDGLGRGAVDRGVGELAGLGSVEHLGVDLGGRNGHRGLLRLAGGCKRCQSSREGPGCHRQTEVCGCWGDWDGRARTEDDRRVARRATVMTAADSRNAVCSPTAATSGPASASPIGPNISEPIAS